MVKRFLFTLLFLAIWLPCLLFTSTNATTSPPLPDKSAMGPELRWKSTERRIDWSSLPPKLLVDARLDTVADKTTAFTLQSDFVEWLYTGNKSARRAVKKGPVQATGLPERPYVTQWDITHDKSIRFSLAGLRFNGYFLMGLFMCLLLPPLFALWLLADDITIVTPQERKRRDDAFLELVKIVEARAKADPGWLEKKTIRLALLGYAVVLGSIILMVPVGLGLAATLVVLTGGNAGIAKFAIILAMVPIGFAFVMAKSLLMPAYMPPGPEISAADAPRLFAYLDHIIKEAEGPRFKRVYISNEINASVSRDTGFLGFFGFGPVTLTLGLPLMQALTLPQLGGVIGHEYGHVAAKDNAKGQWIYRVRNSWLILGDRLGLEHLWYVLKLNRFYSWFIGVFSAYSFALSRKCEYEADAFAAKLAGADHAASALSAIAVRADDVGMNYWKELWKKAEASPDLTSEAPYSKMTEFFSTPRDHATIIENVLKEKTGYGSTHPSTLDRVQALGKGFTPPEPVAKSAAAELLGDFEGKLAQMFNAEWLEQARPHWEQAHQDYKHHAARHAGLKEKDKKDLSDDELKELITAADRFKDDDSILAASEEILRREPGSAVARLNIAGVKLEKGDEAQLSVLEELMKQDAQLYPNACQYAIGFYFKAKREDEAKPWQEKFSNWNYEREAAAEERNLVLASDDYEAHGLPPETVKAIAAHCAQHKVVHTVYLARKKVRYMPEYPAYLLSFKLKYQPFRMQKTIQADLDQFIGASGLTGDYLFIEVNAITGLESKLEKTAGARIYSIKDNKAA